MAAPSPDSAADSTEDSTRRTPSTVTATVKDCPILWVRVTVALARTIDGHDRPIPAPQRSGRADRRKASVVEATDQVRMTVKVLDQAPGVVCTSVGVPQVITAHLSAPLGDSRLVDGAR